MGVLGVGPTPSLEELARSVSTNPLWLSLRELGWMIGQNLIIEYRSAQSQDRLPVTAADLIALSPDLLIASAPRRIPFTLSVVAVMLVAAVATGALWSPLSGSAWWGRVAYGLPAIEVYRWWTPVTGVFFASAPLQYVAVAGGFLVLVGFAELRLGTRRTAIVTVALQLAGVLGASLLLALTWLGERGFSDIEEVDHIEERLSFALPRELRREMEARGTAPVRPRRQPTAP